MRGYKFTFRLIAAGSLAIGIQIVFGGNSDVPDAPVRKFEYYSRGKFGKPIEGQPINLRRFQTGSGMDLYGILQCGGEIHRCFVEEYQSQTEGKDVPEEIGQVRLAVVDTLYGKKRDALRLPYWYPKTTGAVSLGGQSWWPPPPVITVKRQLICIVLSSGHHRIAMSPAQQARDFDGAAVEVFAISDKADPLVQEIEDMCKLHRLAGTKGFKQAVTDALSDQRRIIRRYARSAAEDLGLEVKPPPEDEESELMLKMTEQIKFVGEQERIKQRDSKKRP